ncbi:hypothetical protein GCM10029976_053070 [Kribbella albertanoniae]
MYDSGDPYSVRARRLLNEDESERRDDHRFDVDPKDGGRSDRRWSPLWGGPIGSGESADRWESFVTMADHVEEIRLSAARGLELELNYCMPPDSPEVGQRVESWFVAATEAFASEFVREFPPGGLPSAGLRDRAGGPFGPVGSRWCSLLILEQRNRKVGTSLRPWTPKNWSRFLSLSPSLSIEMSAKFSTLNDFGHAGQPSLTLSAYRLRTAPQWLNLSARYVVGDRRTPPIPDETAEVWSAFLRAEAEKWPPVFGYLADDSFGAGSTRTPLEAMSARFPEQTLPLADSEVRGYSWVTVTSSGVLERLGGIDGLRGSGAFHDITALPSGGAVLQATSRLAQYEGDAVRQVFEALGPVLPEKAPWPDEFDRFKLIYEAPRS